MRWSHVKNRARCGCAFDRDVAVVIRRCWRVAYQYAGRIGGGNHDVILADGRRYAIVDGNIEGAFTCIPGTIFGGTGDYMRGSADCKRRTGGRGADQRWTRIIGVENRDSVVNNCPAC